MFAARLGVVCVALLALVSSAEAKPLRFAAPTGVHGFLLRADEPTTHSFPRTPAFAWNPVAGSRYYQFQLSTSPTFRENGLIFQAKSLTTPVVAPTTTLPWITGSPYALYARARAIVGNTSSPWSTAFGFDMTPPPAPSPMPSYDGLLRWTPVEGADGYQVWLIDIPKFETVNTNVLDEREFYTFHRTPSWTSTVRWRVRAIRGDKNFKDRANAGLSVTDAFGPWSPVYTSTNGAYSGGPITLVNTVSDVVSDGSSASPAHRLMPGFVFKGDESLTGVSAELFRVYVFTDNTCLNRVFTSAVIGGPAYAPRPYGPLPLPANATDLPVARGSYFAADGLEPNGYMADGEAVTATEALPSATPTTAVPADVDTNPSGVGPTAPSAPQQIFVAPGSNLGAPVDLWDTSWPSGGYYWTVVPVEARAPNSFSTSVATAGAAAGATNIPVVNALGFSVGDTVTIGGASNQETATITGTSAGTITVSAPLKLAHGPGEPVARTGGSLRYVDLDLPQDACAAGRVARFGVTSEPALTAAGELFASGLSSNGRLTAGGTARAFYGSPLVSWTPALGATSYEVQWSKKRYPFVPAPNQQNQGALGTMTLGTSAVLPLTSGVWYYRVRGFDYSLSTGSQQMAWSDPARIVVARPRFKVVP